MKPGDPIAIKQLFDEAAPTYDLLNDLLSLGLHRVWKRQLLKSLKPKSGQYWLDLCCGTGDLAFVLARRVSPGGAVLGIDSARAPLQIANQRAKKGPWTQISWVQGNALETGLAPSLFDGAVMAYGLRNLEDHSKALQELHRVLKPGALAGVLDFNRLEESSKGAAFQSFYLRKLVVPIAAKLGLREHYSYLENSLRCFPDGASQVKLALEVGFTKASHFPLAAGQMGKLILKA